MDKYKFIFKIVCGVLIMLLINAILVLSIIVRDTLSPEIIATLAAADVAIAGYIFAHNIKPKKE